MRKRDRLDDLLTLNADLAVDRLLNDAPSVPIDPPIADGWEHATIGPWRYYAPYPESKPKFRCGMRTKNVNNPSRQLWAWVYLEDATLQDTIGITIPQLLELNTLDDLNQEDRALLLALMRELLMTGLQDLTDAALEKDPRR